MRIKYTLNIPIFSCISVCLLFLLCPKIQANSNEKENSTQSVPWTENNNLTLTSSLSNERLTFKGGIELTSDNSSPFGGFSSAFTDSTGNIITCISDFTSSSYFKAIHRSRWYQYQLIYNEKNEIVGVKHIMSGQVCDENEMPIKGEIESVAQIGTTYYISFDNKRKLGNQIWTFTPLNNTEKWIAKPSKLHIPHYPPANHNEGIECMTETDESQLFLVHETLPGLTEKSERFAWLINSEKNSSTKLIYQGNLQEIKGATTLKNGNIIVLEKTFAPSNKSTRINLVRISQEELKNKTISGTIIFDVSSPYFDNFEGITSFNRNGKSFILLVSDNNGDWNLNADGKPIQKNILFLFEVKRDL